MKNKMILYLLLILPLLSMVGCNSSVKPIHDSIRGEMQAKLQSGIKGYGDAKTSNENNLLPAKLDAALLPNAVKKRAVNQEKKFNISAQEMPAKEFFLSLIKGTGYNIVVSPKVQGDITLTLNQVTLEEVLHTVRDIYGFEYVKNRDTC